VNLGARWIATAAVALAGGACSADAGRLPTAEIVDTAGVRLITFDLTGVEVPTHRVVGDHDVHIGEMDGAPEYTFSRIADVVIAGDGSIVVSDGIVEELRVYDADGTYVRTIGRRGEGPGEFAIAPSVAGVAGDTVFAFDDRSDRLTVLTMSGDLIETIGLRSEAVGRPVALIRQDDGTYLSQSRWTNPNEEVSFHDVRLELDSTVIEHLDPAGGLIDTVRVMADRTRARIVQDGGGGVVRAMEAVTPYASRAVMASDGARAILGHSDTFELELLGPEGTAQAVLRVLGVLNPATADEIRARQEAAVRAELGDGEIDPTVWRFNIEYLPERLPAFQNVVVSEEGDVWVSLTEYDLSGGLDWLVFTRTGELRGKVHTPPELRLRQVHDDFVVGFVLDELDVPYVRRYPLLPG
jgi:hypothetical protein